MNKIYFIFLGLLVLLGGCSQNNEAIVPLEASAEPTSPNIPEATIEPTAPTITEDTQNSGENRYCTQTNYMQICNIFSFLFEDELIVFLQEQPTNPAILPFPHAPVRADYLNYQEIAFVGSNGENIFVQQDTSLRLPSDLFPELRNTMVYRLPLSTFGDTDQIDAIIPIIGYQIPVPQHIVIDLDVLKAQKKIQLEKQIIVGGIKIDFTTAYYVEATSTNGLPGIPTHVTLAGNVTQTSSLTMLGLGEEKIGVAAVEEDTIQVIRILSNDQQDHQLDIQLGNAYIVHRDEMPLNIMLQPDDSDLANRLQDYLLDCCQD